MDKKINIVVLVLAILLVLAVGYIAYGFYSDAKLQEQMKIYQSGAQVGYEQAVSQLYERAKSCQQVPINYNNETINVVAIECLQQQATE